MVVLLFVLLKRSFAYTHCFNSICQVISQHGKGVCGVIVEIFHRKTEAGQLVHGLAVIIIPAFITAEIEAAHSRGMLFNPR